MTTAVAEGLFRQNDGSVHLIAGRRRADGEMRFPMPTGPDAALFEPTELAATGKLWSYTVQRFRPKTPPYIGADDDKSFRPFALGYVEFPGQVIVEGRILTDAPDSLKIGQPMKVDLESFPTSTRGEVLTYAFRPA